MSINRIFIANRGEIAVRIIKAAHELGIHTIQGYSESDADMLAVKLAKESICIGGSQAKKSYLNISSIIKSAVSTFADAIHPGYGFLSENPNFARAVENAGMIFIGPQADTIECMGDKVSARQMAESAGVPVVPGSKGRIDSIEDGLKEASSIGYPIMIKASAGGGGRGIRLAQDKDELQRMVAISRSEAIACFGDGGLYLERFIPSPRHIEVQILGDSKNFLHCFERECSLQRNRQKIWEEAGAECLNEKTRDAICAASVALAKSVNYCGAGTVEYLYDQSNEEFYFIEMNTRIQVEHPISEMITGIDLVQEMIQIASGQPLSIKQSDVKRMGHAIEVRINAEDPAKQFLPFPGQVGTIKIPEGKHIRFDHFLYEGYRIPPFYDSLLGKMIVHGEDRMDTIIKLRSALKSLEITGLKTTIPLHLALVDDKNIQAGVFHTQWLESWLSGGNLNTKAIMGEKA